MLSTPPAFILSQDQTLKFKSLTVKTFCLADPFRVCVSLRSFLLVSLVYQERFRTISLPDIFRLNFQKNFQELILLVLKSIQESENLSSLELKFSRSYVLFPVLNFQGCSTVQLSRHMLISRPAGKPAMPCADIVSGASANIILPNMPPFVNTFFKIFLVFS